MSALATTLSFGNVIVPAEASTIEPDGTSRAQNAPPLCEETAKEIGALIDKNIAITMATGRSLEALMASKNTGDST